MDSTILAILLQDGVVNGAIYALLALSLVLVFAVTRVIYVAQGEFVAYGALTYAALDGDHLPGSVALLVGVAESFSSFWASAFKEVIVFTAIIPVLLWRSLRHGPAEEEE